MRKEAILHIPMSEYAHGLDEKHIVYRIRCAKGDMKKVVLYYGDTACRVTPIIFTPITMELVASDANHDYWQAVVESLYNRVYYYFLLDDGDEQIYYYGDIFTNRLVDDRSQYFKLPFNHRADIARVPKWVENAVVYNIFPDSFATGYKNITNEPTKLKYMDQDVHGKLGGTLTGIKENIDYLLELGVNCVYLNPIFVAGEYHKYDLLDYYHIDPCFGGDKAFKELVDELHKNNIRIIIDGVFNHCGWYFFAFDDVVKNQEKSKYVDWFYGLKFPVIRPDNPEDYPTYECFAYERMMPKLNTANKEVREYFCNVGKYWAKEFQIDGWRLDVASEVDDMFWREFRKAVKEVNPEIILVGEVWESANHWLKGDMFDSAMNYDLRKHCNLFFAEESIDAAEFSGRITNMLMRYKLQITPAQMNLLDSHDVSRFLSLCNGNVDRYKLAVLFQMIFVGMPTVFYGNEQGIQGILEEEYRHPMTWDNQNQELFDYFKTLIEMRKKYSVFGNGSFAVTKAEQNSKFIVFVRENESECVTIIMNLNKKSKSYEKPPGELYLADKMQDNVLDYHGYAIYVQSK